MENLGWLMTLFNQKRTYVNSPAACFLCARVTIRMLPDVPGLQLHVLFIASHD
jgi:hypothetical protein